VTAVTFPTSLAELDAMPTPMVALSLDGKILAMNAAALRLGTRQRDEIVGRMAWEFAPGMEYLWDERVAAARGPDGETFEIAITSGRGAWMVEYVFKLCELDGQPMVVGVITRARRLT
jgi:PAS domain-containing protein